MEEIKPCPFCGGEAEIRIVGIGGYDTAREIRCQRCGCGTDYYDDSHEAVEAWNRRIERVSVKGDFIASGIIPNAFVGFLGKTEDGKAELAKKEIVKAFNINKSMGRIE